MKRREYEYDSEQAEDKEKKKRKKEKHAALLVYDIVVCDSLSVT